MPKLAPNNHVNLTVRDLEASTQWYCRVFGLVVVSDEDNTGSGAFTDVRYRGLLDPRRCTTSSG